MGTKNKKAESYADEVKKFFEQAPEKLLEWINSNSETLLTGGPEDIEAPSAPDLFEEVSGEKADPLPMYDISGGKPEKITPEELLEKYSWIKISDFMIQEGFLPSIIINNQIQSVFLLVENVKKKLMLFDEDESLEVFIQVLAGIQNRVKNILYSANYELSEKKERIGSVIMGIFSKLLVNTGPVKIDDFMDIITEMNETGKSALRGPEVDINEIKKDGGIYYEIVMRTDRIMNSFYATGRPFY